MESLIIFKKLYGICICSHFEYTCQFNFLGVNSSDLDSNLKVLRVKSELLCIFLYIDNCFVVIYKNILQ